MRRFLLALISLICLTLFLQAASPARAARLELTDRQGEKTIIEKPEIRLKDKKPLKNGLMVKKGKGVAMLDWGKIKKVVFNKPYQAKITLKNGKEITAEILTDQTAQIQGETELGSFQLSLKDLETIEVLSERKTGVQKYTPTGPRVVGPMKIPKISVPKIKIPQIKLPGVSTLGSIPKPKGNKKNFVRFVNRSGQPACVRLFDQKTSARVVEVEVPNQKTKGVLTKNGVYFIVTRYGETEKDYRYSKGKKITVQPPPGKRQVVTITLHKIKGGNYPTQKADKNQFEGK
jgi:hypothetical protein